MFWTFLPVIVIWGIAILVVVRALFFLHTGKHLSFPWRRPRSKQLLRSVQQQLIAGGGVDAMSTTPTLNSRALSGFSLGSSNDVTSVWSRFRKLEEIRDPTFVNVIGLLYRAGPGESDGRLTLEGKVRSVMQYNDRLTEAQARAWFQRAFELTL